METSRDILIVDDHPATAGFLIEALREFGFLGRAAYDGASALQAIQSAQPGLVLLDLHLPDLSGADLVAELHRNDLAQVPIVLMTADRASVAHLPMTMFTEYLIKPFDLDTLVACVARYICPRER